MQKNIFKKSLLFLGSIFFAGYMTFSNPVYAKEQSKKQNDKFSLQIMAGYLSSSVCNIGPEIKDISYSQINIRIGKKLKSFQKSSLEALAEFSNSRVHKGFGDYFIGTTFLLRYSAFEPDWKIIPYAQVGFGGVYTDAHKDHSQDAIGKPINFTPQASLGFRYLIDKNWSVDTEAMFHHVSCGNCIFNNNDKNDGINSFGIFMGFTHNF